MAPVSSDSRRSSCAPADTSKSPSASPGMRKSKASRWRVTVLISVHVLFVIHLTHWFVTGRTVSPVEPSESMFFLERGELNAGLIFFAVAILSTALFGRFFCGWGCHIVALQDLCGWFMKRIGIRPRLFRSRLLVYVPLILALYMFAWPSFRRFVLDPALQAWFPTTYAQITPVGPFPEISNHLLTEDFWATFASPAVAVPFLLVCGFATVYFLGAKGFCTYGCPYGGLFFPVDRIAVGKILANLDACEKCGHCTASCTSNVQVHKEIQIHNQVVSPGCMKCLDCVSVCPTGALSYGIGKPSLFSRGKGTKNKRSYDLTWPEEIGLSVFGFAAFYAVRGAYASIPMLFAVGIAGCLTFLTWKLWRLFRDADVRLHRFSFKKRGVWQTSGRVYATLICTTLALLAHTGIVSWQLKSGEARSIVVSQYVSYDTILLGMPVDLYGAHYREMAAEADRAYRRAQPWWQGGWGLFPTPGLDQSLANMAVARGKFDEAEAHLRRMHSGGPSDAHTYALARVLVLQSNTAAAESLLRETLAQDPDLLETRRELAKLYLGTSRPEQAISLYEEYLEDHPQSTLTRCRLALEVLLPLGRLEAAHKTLQAAAERTSTEDPKGDTLDTSLTTIARALAQKNGTPEDSRALLDLASARRPESLALFRERAILTRHMDGVDAAIASYEAEIAKTSKDQLRLYLALDHLIPAQRFDAAQAQLQQLLDRVDDLRRAARQELDGACAAWARARAQAGESTKATEFLSQVVATRHDMLQARSAWANLLMQTGKSEEAIAVFESYLADEPRDATARARLGAMLIQLERKTKGLEQLRRAAQDNPHSGKILSDLGLGLFHNQKLPEAIDQMREAQARSPHHRPTIGILMELLQLSGRTDEAQVWQSKLQLLERINPA